MKKTVYELLLDRLGTGNVLTRQEIEMFKSLVERPYKVYTALLTQSGTDAPVATVLENTLGGTVALSYQDTGTYGIEVLNITVGYVVIILGTGNVGTPLNFTNSILFTDDDLVGAITCYSLSGGNWVNNDDLLSLTPIEIRVYP